MWVLIRMVAILIVLGAAAPAGAEVPEGSFMFNRRCATCHMASALMPRLMKLPDEEERAQFLNKFLAGHHARDETERKAIVDYLVHYQPR